MDDIDFDEEQGQEVECVGNQGQYVWNVKCMECQLGCGYGVKVFGCFYCYGINNLNVVIDVDCEYQEWYQN